MEWQKLAFFVHCFVSTCLANQPTTVLELGLSVALFELNRTIWQDFFAFLWFILPRATFLVTSYILLSWNIENLLLNHHILTTCVAKTSTPCILPTHTGFKNIFTGYWNIWSLMQESRALFFKINAVGQWGKIIIKVMEFAHTLGLIKCLCII